MQYDQDPLPPPPRPHQGIREKVKLPGIFLIIVGVLSVLIVVAGVAMTFRILQMTDAEIDDGIKLLGQTIPQLEEMLRQQIKDAGSMEEAKRQFARQQFIQSGLSLIAAVVTILGGISLIKLRRHGLAVTGSILSALPVISPCCCMGQAVGIWALVVLFNTDVKAAFKANIPSHPPPAEGMLG